MLKFDNTVSSGHLITLVSMALAGAATYGVHITSLEHLVNTDRSHAAILEKYQDRFDRQELSIHNLGLVQERTIALLSNIERGFQRLEDQQREQKTQ